MKTHLLVAASVGAIAPAALLWATYKWTAGQPAAASVLSPHAGMTLVFDEEFNDNTPHKEKWYFGGKPTSQDPLNGEQYSDAHFVGRSEPQFDQVYSIKDSILTIRAIHDANYADPQMWKRKWYSGQISTAFPTGRISGAIRKGYIETRMKLPAGKGPWPAFWALNTQSVDKSHGGGSTIELDFVEAYGFPHNFNPTVHLWQPNGQDSAGKSANITTDKNLTSEFHTYGALITEDHVAVFLDGMEQWRRPLPPVKLGDAFFTIIDLGIGGGWPIEVPSQGFYEMQIDYVRMYEDK